MRCVAKANAQFLDEPRFAETGLAHDQHQLPIALAHSFPAPHLYRDLFLATDQWREMALARAASAAARPDNAKKRHRLRHALKLIPAATKGRRLGAEQLP
jgi:hypothetical protein